MAYTVVIVAFEDGIGHIGVTGDGVRFTYLLPPQKTLIDALYASFKRYNLAKSGFNTNNIEHINRKYTELMTNLVTVSSCASKVIVNYTSDFSNGWLEPKDTKSKGKIDPPLTKTKIQQYIINVYEGLKGFFIFKGEIDPDKFELEEVARRMMILKHYTLLRAKDVKIDTVEETQVKGSSVLIPVDSFWDILLISDKTPYELETHLMFDREKWKEQLPMIGKKEVHKKEVGKKRERKEDLRVHPKTSNTPIKKGVRTLQTHKH